MRTNLGSISHWRYDLQVFGDPPNGSRPQQHCEMPEADWWPCPVPNLSDSQRLKGWWTFQCDHFFFYLTLVPQKSKAFCHLFKLCFLEISYLMNFDISHSNSYINKVDKVFNCLIQVISDRTRTWCLLSWLLDSPIWHILCYSSRSHTVYTIYMNDQTPYALSCV